MGLAHSFAVVVPVYKPGAVWTSTMNAILSQDMEPGKVLIIDSGSEQKVIDDAENAGFHVVQIDSTEFDHGGTRQYAVNLCKCYPFIIYLTQDAILSGKQAFRSILEPFDDDNVAAVCGRQLPRNCAGPIERHIRMYNYPERSSIRSSMDIPRYGLKTAFLSNSFAAYRTTEIMAAGGFPEKIIFGEDMYLAAKFLMMGKKICYNADACVEHSHAYSFFQEFSRYFDMGVFHARESWIIDVFGRAEGEGLKFIRSEFHFLLRNAYWRIPEAILRIITRYLGFRLGLHEAKLPVWLKKRAAMNSFFFRDPDLKA